MRTDMIVNETRGKLYYTIQNKPLSLSEKEVSLLFDRSRLDPRLMEVMTEFIRDFWWNLDAGILNKNCKKAKYPFIIKAAISCILDHCEFDAATKTDFIKWTHLAIRGIKDPNPQFLYFGIYPIGSKSMAREIKEALPCFLKHNLIAKDLPFNKGISGSVKSESTLPPNKVSELDLLKIKLAQKIKDLKAKHNISNAEIMKITGINRVFLSKILNNKLESITSEYLAKHAPPNPLKIPH